MRSQWIFLFSLFLFVACGKKQPAPIKINPSPIKSPLSTSKPAPATPTTPVPITPVSPTITPPPQTVPTPTPDLSTPSLQPANTVDAARKLGLVLASTWKTNIKKILHGEYNDFNKK